ncbi:MAG: hypothetical protein QW140_00880 [Candidatus Aenigmatarchaeota archaeon]
MLERLPELRTELLLETPIIYLGERKPRNPVYKVISGCPGNCHLVISDLGKKLIKVAEEIEKVVKINRPKKRTNSN